MRGYWASDEKIGTERDVGAPEIALQRIIQARGSVSISALCGSSRAHFVRRKEDLLMVWKPDLQPWAPTTAADKS